MGFWKKMEEVFFTGKILKDYGTIYETRPFPWWKVEYRVMLTERNGARRVVIRQTAGMKGETNYSYHEWDLEGARRLKEILDEIIATDTP